MAFLQQKLGAPWHGSDGGHKDKFTLFISIPELRDSVSLINLSIDKPINSYGKCM
jgi:hypothetical protein